MPLFSSLSTKESKEGSNHHNKLGKSAHARAASLTGRKGSIGGKNTRVDEDASIKAMAGSRSQLQQDDSTGTEYVKPMTPKSLRQQSMDQMEDQDVPPTPPPHEVGGYAVTNDEVHNPDSHNGSLHTNSSATWREKPDAAAMRNRAANANDAGHTEMAGAGLDYGHQNDAHVLSGNKMIDLATARQKVQFAMEAELAADRALELARKAVEEARSIVGALERQAHQEFERAHARRMETAGVVKDLEKLGRHSH